MSKEQSTIQVPKAPKAEAGNNIQFGISMVGYVLIFLFGGKFLMDRFFPKKKEEPVQVINGANVDIALLKQATERHDDNFKEVFARLSSQDKTLARIEGKMER